MKSETVRKIHKWHVWTGLLSGLNIFILSITGSILVFVHELHEAIGPEMPLVIETDDPASLRSAEVSPILQEINSRHSGYRPAFLGIPTPAEHAEDPEHFAFFFELQRVPSEGNPEERAENGPDHLEFFFDPGTGQYAGEGEEIDIPEWIWYLHANLFAGTMGQIFLGFIAVAFFISTVTGLIIYGPFMKGLLFGMIRMNVPIRLWMADLHKLIGIATLVFNLLMAGTGLLLTLGQFLVNVYSYTVISSLEPPQSTDGPRVSVERILDVSSDALPGTVRWIYFPGQLQGEHHYAAIAYEAGYFFSRLPHVALIDAYSGKLSRVVDIPWFIEAVYVSQPLHFGDFGGLALRIVYSVLGLSSGTLAITGFILYLRRRGRGRDPRSSKKQPTIGTGANTGDPSTETRVPSLKPRD